MASELYLFQYNGTYYGFTPTVLSKTLNTITYSPAIITRSNLTITSNLAKSPVTFKFERSHSFAKLLLQELPETPILVTIYRNSSQYWKGRVLEVTANPLTIEITCDSIFSTLARGGVSPKIQLQCRYTLYSTNCGVTKEAYTAAYTVSGISGKTITITPITQTNGYFTNGIAAINGQQRNIVLHSGNNLTLTASFIGTQSGTLTLYPGCKLTKDDCNTKFNNLLNFGGFPYIPKRNSFGTPGAL